MQAKFAAAWADHKTMRVPRVIAELSSQRVLTMVRARGKTVVDAAASASPDVRRAGRGRDLRVRVGLAARARPPQRRSESRATSSSRPSRRPRPRVVPRLRLRARAAGRPSATPIASCGGRCSTTTARQGRPSASAWRSRSSGLLRRTDSLATTAHRDWERALAAAARDARRLPLERRLRRGVCRDHRPRARGRRPAATRAAAVAVAAAARRRRRDRHARRARAVPPRAARRCRHRPPRSSLSATLGAREQR